MNWKSVYKGEHSILQRLIFGTLAASGQVVVNFVTQLLLLPLFLSCWDLATYGAWLTINAVFSLALTLEVGHQNFLGYEFQMNGGSDRKQLSLTLCSSFVVAVVIWIIEYAVIISIITVLFHNRSHDLGTIVPQIGIGFLYFISSLYMISWLLTGAMGGIAARALIPFGYYARVTTWGSLGQLVTSLAPAVAVFWGADLIWAAIAYNAAVLAVNVPMLLNVASLLKKENVGLVFPDVRLGMLNFRRSVWLSIRQTIEALRQHGVRVFITPLIGAPQLAVFVANRTVANTVLQGISIGTGPIFPEIVGLLALKDKERVLAAFELLLLTQMILLLPGIAWIQTVMPYVFDIWTRGKIDFDFVLFWLFSTEISLLALGTISRAVVQGANLVQAQLWISVAAGFVLLVLSLTLVNTLGVRAVAVGLLAAESLVLVGYTAFAIMWLQTRHFQWPAMFFLLACGATALSSIFVLMSALFPAQRVLFALAATVSCAVLARLAWASVSSNARAAITSRLRLVPLRWR